MSKKATSEAVVLIREDGKPIVMIIGNGHVEHYKLTPMRFRDHAELWEVDKAPAQQ